MLPAIIFSLILQAPTEQRHLLFAVQGPNAQSMTLDPIAFWDGARFSPLPDQCIPAQTEGFAASYLDRGHQYTLLSGGVSAGTVRVTQAIGKDSPDTEITLEASDEVAAHLCDSVSALATDDPSLGR